MNISEAQKIYRKFYSNPHHTDDENFIFTEAMNYLIEETHDPEYMMSLGGYYYETKNFDLALKYYEMAAEYNFLPSFIGLGYIYYYGRTGTRDYEKAFEYYSKAMELGDINSAYKVADMYKNGYYVEKNYDKYKSIIESLYPKIKNANRLNQPLPEIFTRLAKIRSEEGKIHEAVELYLSAKNFLAQRIKYDPFFGNLSIMKWLIADLYKLVEFDYENPDFYDLYHLLNMPCTVIFACQGKQTVKSYFDSNGEHIIEFNGKYFRSTDDFFAKASVNGKLLTYLYDTIYFIEVMIDGDN